MNSPNTALVAALALLGFLPIYCQGSELPAESLYQLRADLLAQKGDEVRFDLYRGHPVLVSMFYGSCPAACPMLITSMQVYESQLDEAAQARLRVLLVSFDAAHDTPEQLGRLARLHRTDPARWTFANASDPDSRRIAALLGIRYRALPDGSFDHSLLITLLDGEGRVLASTTKLFGDKQFQARLQAATGSGKR